MIKGVKRRKEYSEIESELKKPILPAILLLTVIVIGTLGYSYLWKDLDSTFIDAIYMTIITITTVGYGEIHQLNSTGRVFTMLIAIAGIGSLFYVLSVVMENLVIIQLNNYRGQKKKMKKIEKLHNHIILVGHGRVGHLAALELARAGQTFVAIDDSFDDPEYIPIDDNMLMIEGDATEDEVLLKAGIERARGVIVATADSATNVFVVLSAKVLNPKLFIVARADSDANLEKLKRAGADRVVNPYSIGGQRLAQLIVNTNVLDVFETSFGTKDNNLKIENIDLTDRSIWFNKTLKEIDLRQKTGASILAVIRESTPILNPGGDFKIIKGDQLLVIGTKEQMKSIEQLALLTN
jgi:voltage-gated potassium channel